MLTARSVILAILVTAVLTATASLVSLFWGGESYSNLGRDSYGTQADGYRAVHDLLDALDFQTSRAFVPSLPPNPRKTSYVLWDPRDYYVQTEPSYLNQLAEWVRAGGRLVVTTSAQVKTSKRDDCPQCRSKNCSTCIPISLLDELGLDGVAIQAAPGVTKRDSASRAKYESRAVEDRVRDIFRAKEYQTATHPFKFEGEWSDLEPLAKRIEISVEQPQQIVFDRIEPTAQLTIAGSREEATSTIAAMFPLGEGTITVISQPLMASNASLANADNSVLLTHLLTGLRKQIVFDEFYHGLTVRGNAFWLLSKRPYLVMTLSLLVVLGIWVWRSAIFLGPSREDLPTSRRTLDEYVEAMSRFLLKGRGSEKYILSELSDGVLWHTSRMLGLPPSQQDVQAIVGILSRRSPLAARQLDTAMRHAKEVLNNPKAKQEEILQATRKVSDCLSK